MPFTPFHFGPGALLHAAAPRQVSFLAFCASNVIIDLESLANLVRQRDPVHAFLHTVAGATLVAAAVLVLFLGLRAFDARVRLPDLFGWRALGARPVAIGAALGAWSHVVLDGVMHGDLRPWSPFAAGNPLLGLVSVDVLHLACLALGGLGVLWLAVRRLVAGDRAAR